MKKLAALALLLCLMMLSGTALADQACWGIGYGYIKNSGTLEAALAAAAADTTGESSYIWLEEEISDAAYTINAGNFILDLDRKSVTAAAGKSAFTVKSGAEVQLEGYGAIFNGSSACIAVDGGSASLGAWAVTALTAADEKPAVVMNSGIVYIGRYCAFENGSRSCDIQYESGRVELDGYPNDVRVRNASGKDVPVNAESGDTILLPESCTVLDENGNQVTTLKDGKVYKILQEEGAAEVFVNGFPIDGQYIDNNSQISVTKPDGGYAYYADGVLTLNNFKGERIDVECGNATIMLIGENVIESDADLIDVDYGTLTIKGSGSLKLKNTVDSDGIDVTDGNLYIESGSIYIEAGDHGIEMDNGNCQFVMNGGLLDISAGDEGIDVTDGDLHIEGGAIYIEAEDYGIDIGDGDSQFVMNGGLLDIKAGDDGVDSEYGITINGGTITIRTEDNGLDSDQGDIVINGGNLDIYVEDNDGISSGRRYEVDEEEAVQNIFINGGSIRIDAQEHALYASGKITLRNAVLEMAVRDENGMVAVALLEMDAEGMPVIKGDKSLILDEGLYADTGFWMLGNENGPLKQFSFAPSSADLPKTGDDSSIMLYVMLMSLSIVALALPRRREN